MSRKPAAELAPAPAAEREEQLPAAPAPAPATRALTLDLSVQDLLRQKRAIAEMLKEVLIDGVHYGPSFPGDDRKTLHQPGADALIVAFGLVPRFDMKREDIAVSGEGMHREYTVTCTLFTRGGQELGSGIGSCSTMEGKYRWRNARPKCPGCQHDGSLIRTKGGRNPGGWWCVPDKGGCGNNYDKGAREVEGQALGKVPNADIADTYNTILKVGAKRAKVAATILVTGCADMFTQDLEEDLDGDDHADDRAAAGKRSAPEQQPPANQPPPPPPPPPPGQTPQAALIEANLAKAHKASGDAIGKPTTSKVWKAISDKLVRLDWLQRAAKAGAAIRAIRGADAEQLLSDLTIDRENPDDLDGMLADLERFAVPPTAAKPAQAPAPATTTPAKPAGGGGGSHAPDDEPPFAPMDPRSV